jgi:hypothetical protein
MQVPFDGQGMHSNNQQYNTLPPISQDAVIEGRLVNSYKILIYPPPPSQRKIQATITKGPSFSWLGPEHAEG